MKKIYQEPSTKVYQLKLRKALLQASETEGDQSGSGHGTPDD